MTKLNYDKNTEVFRTIRNLRGYNDAERGFPVSLVDDSEYEDINVLVKRFMAGERLPIGKSVSYDTTDPAVTNEQLMGSMSPVQGSDFDLADTGPILDGIKARQEASTSVSLTSPASPDGSPVVEPSKAPTDVIK